MALTNLLTLAAKLPTSWQSTVIGEVAGGNFKILRMDGNTYPNEAHEFNEALVVLEGQLNLRFGETVVPVMAGEVYIVPAGVPHAVASGSFGTLVIIDQ